LTDNKRKNFYFLIAIFLSNGPMIYIIFVLIVPQHNRLRVKIP
jgi:hypothetical protein